MLIKGKEETGLREAVESLDSITRVDSVVSNGPDINITCQKIKGQLVNWTIEQNGETKTIAYEKGRGFNDLFDAIKKCTEENDISEDITVLCYMGVSVRREGSKIKTWWAVINPAVPFEIINGKPDFEILPMELDDAEYRIAMESRMGFYNEFSKDFYPIRETAFSSIGKLLDSAASFRNIPDIPLGNALLVANRISTDMKGLKFIVRNGKDHFKPLMGVAGARFAYEPESVFFDRGIEQIGKMFGPHFVGDWSITDEASTANVFVSSTDGSERTKGSLGAYRDFPIYVRLQTSDIPGVSASVTAVAQIGSGYVIIQKNSAYHWDTFLKRGGVESLFTRKEGEKTISIKDDIDSFVDKIRFLKEHDITINDDVLKRVDSILKKVGMRRMSKMDAVDAEYGKTENGYDFLLRIINGTYHKFPLKKWNELAYRYSDLVESLVKAVASHA